MDLLAQKMNPNAHRKASRAVPVGAAANTLEAVAREWFESAKPRPSVALRG